MNKLFIISVIILIVVWAVCGCRTTKIKDGNKVLTANARHMMKIHPNGMYAGGKYIRFKTDSVTAKK